ncbi:outer membrane beta-barrel protein [Flavihumibacter rivuli]|uniref:outer membrane beta-barrel protein n=1 Tax=Flavihumibacter rivuli TaxID=2838156 RepID=UPI001BDF405E|nr:outer membrane beta-barrel protein [Flavihumibacter rivuli]ULQ58106.1 outer membrane beta-barrel protein [Flavihumibacter rivuli]
MKKLTIFLSIALMITLTSQAQHNMFGISWGINIPNNSSYLDKTSFAGGKVEWRHFINKKFSAGLSLDWATYEQYLPRQTFKSADGNSAITSDFVAQAYQLPITATAHYYFGEGTMFKPFAGLAIGAQYMQNSLYYNVYVSDEYSWGFVVRPEIGAIIKPNPSQNWGILLGANYSYSTNKIEVLNRDSFRNIGFNIGFIFEN